MLLLNRLLYLSIIDNIRTFILRSSLNIFSPSSSPLHRLPPGLGVHPATPVLVSTGGECLRSHPRLKQQEAGSQTPASHDLCLAVSPPQTMCGQYCAHGKCTR